MNPACQFSEALKAVCEACQVFQIVEPMYYPDWLLCKILLHPERRREVVKSGMAHMMSANAGRVE